MKLRLVDAANYATTTPPQLEWIVDGLVPLGGITMLSAAPKAGKSNLALSMLIAISQGRPWLKLPARSTKCLYVDGEVGGNELHRRIYRLSKGLGEDADLSGRMVLTSDRIDLEDDECVKALIDAVKMGGFELVCMDPISKMHTGCDGGERSAKLALSAIDEIRRQTGATILLVNHFGRAAAKRKTAGDRYYGSVRFAADAVSILELDRRSDQHLVLTHTDCRYSRPMEPITLMTEIDDEIARYTQIDGEDRDVLVGDSALDWLCGFLEEFFDESSDEGLWIPKSVIANEAAARGMSLSTLDRALKSAQEMTLVERQKLGREARFRISLWALGEHMSCVTPIENGD